MAFYGWPVSQCQTVPLVAQLEGGIRVIDIRLAVVPHPDALKGLPVKSTVNPELIAYHGWWSQQTPFVAILNDVYRFLSSPAGQSETIIMSVKQEDAEVTPPPFFSQMVRDAIVHGPGGGGGGLSGNDSKATDGSGVNRGMWFLENRIPTLGEVRGKVVMLSRFGGDGAAWPERLEGIGIHPTVWPDNKKEGFEWDLKGTRVRTHDWYGITSFLSIPEKFKLGTMNVLLPPGQPDFFVVPITYFSAASFPFALPPVVAKGFGWPRWGLGVYGINTLLGEWLLERMGGVSGWTLMDYCSERGETEVVPLLVECNFLGRRRDGSALP